MNDRRTALTYARRFRKCPPAAVRPIPQGRKAVADNEAGCPRCGDPDIAGDALWNELARRIGAEAPKTDPPPTRLQPPPLRPGDLCLIRPALGRWVEADYFTPPLVMILAAESRVSDEIQVAQVYHDPVMAGPGDLILTDDQTGIGDLFVEPWNRYTLRKRDVEGPVATLGPEILQAVVALADDVTAYPPWAMRPRPLKAEDPRGYFREMEIEVGYVFSIPAVAGMI